MLKRLTDFDTGETVYVDVSKIVSMRRLKASVLVSSYGVSMELGERTRIDTERDTFLVRESPEEVMICTPDEMKE